MNDFASSPLSQLRARQRTYEDLARFIRTRAGDTPNYTLLLGAGCSVTSGVRSATSLVEEWRKDLYLACGGDPNTYTPDVAKALLSDGSNTGWYNSQREYSALFEKKYDLPRQRRMFVEAEVSGAAPSLGYAYLIRLIEKGFLNTVFTTNFDDLVNEAFFRFSEVRPITCAHDSSITSITVTSKRPKVIKLHGDYLFDDIKSTLPETESLEENTREKFIEFGKDFGLVVIGYSGCDRSVMDVLHHLLRRDDYLKNGIYWCIRKGERPSDELLKLLWRDRVYFVEIDGFDEVMAALHEDLIGPELPIDTSFVSEKPRNLITSLCNSTALGASQSTVIKRDLDRLKKQNEREGLLSAFRNVKDDSDELTKHTPELSDGDLVKILAVKQLISSCDWSSARDKIASLLASTPSAALKTELMIQRFRVEENSGERNGALSAIEELIEYDPNDPRHLMAKARLTVSHDERMQLAARAIAIDEFRSSTWNSKFDLLVEMYRAGLGPSRTALISEIKATVSRSLEINPSIRNDIWWDSICFYFSASITKEELREAVEPLLKMAAAQNPYRIRSLRARLKLLVKDKAQKSDEAERLLADVRLAKSNRSIDEQPYYEWLELDALHKLDRKDELSQKISALDVNPRYNRDPIYLSRKADFLAKFSGDLAGAAQQLEQALKGEFSGDRVIRLSGIYEDLGQAEKIDDLITRYGKQLHPLQRAFVERERASAAGDYERALSLLRSTYPNRIFGVTESIAESHDLIQVKRYAEAERVSRKALETLNWDLQHGELLINHELSKLRGTEGKVNKAKLGQLADSTDSVSVAGCARYLLGDLEKAKKALKEGIAENRELYFAMKNWAIFNDSKGQAFLSQLGPQ